MLSHDAVMTQLFIYGDAEMSKNKSQKITLVIAAIVITAVMIAAKISSAGAGLVGTAWALARQRILFFRLRLS